MKAILTYHSIDESGSVVSISEATFRTHVQWLASSGVSIVPLAQLASMPAGANAIALTFDDGFVNFARIAWPLLRAHGLPATLFVVPDCVGTINRWESNSALHIPALPLLGWDALGALAEEGVDLGSHSRSHPHLPQLRGRQLIDEVEGAAARIRAETGQRPEAFAYPYGEYDTEVTGVVGAVHRLACTTEFRSLRLNQNLLRLPRLDTYYFRRAGRLESWGSGAFRRYLWFRRGGRRLRRVLKAGTRT